MVHLDALEPKFAEFQKRQVEELNKCLTGESEAFTDLKDNWVGTENGEVIKHYPPQLIIGKQVEDDVLLHTDDSNPLVRVELYALTCEYAYSAPTGLFNAQLPRVQLRTNQCQLRSYEVHKRMEAT